MLQLCLTFSKILAPIHTAKMAMHVPKSYFQNMMKEGTKVCRNLIENFSFDFDYHLNYRVVVKCLKIKINPDR